MNSSVVGRERYKTDAESFNAIDASDVVFAWPQQRHLANGVTSSSNRGDGNGKITAKPGNA